VLSDRGRLSLAEDGYRLERRTRVWVRTPAGRAQGRVEIPLDPWTEILDLRARSFPAGGGPRVALDPSAVGYRALAAEWGLLFSDRRAAVFDVPGVDPGDVIEVGIRLRVRQRLAIEPWRFDGPLPVLLSAFTVEVPDGLPIYTGFVAEGRIAPLVANEGPGPGGGRRLSFALRDLDPWPRPGGERLGRALRVSTHRDWAALVSQFRAGPTPPLAGAAEILAQARAAAPGAGDAEALFNWVRDGFRYVAFAEGPGAFQPHPPAEVVAARFGDCKDLSELLVALYRAAGLEAWPVLLAPASGPPFDPRWVDLGAFDHQIVAFKEGSELRFVDPTGPGHAFVGLPWSDQGAAGLLLADRVEPIETPKSDAGDNREERVWQIEAGSAEHRRVRLELVATGAASEHWRALARDPRGQKRALAALISGEPPELLAHVVAVERDRVRVGATFQVANLSRTIESIEVLALGRLLAAPPDAASPRAFPRTLIDRFVLRPGPYRSIDAPEDRAVPAIRWSRRWDDDRLILERTAEVTPERPAAEVVAALARGRRAGVIVEREVRSAAARGRPEEAR
jgi:hypothetical protein